MSTDILNIPRYKTSSVVPNPYPLGVYCTNDVKLPSNCHSPTSPLDLSVQFFFFISFRQKDQFLKSKLNCWYSCNSVKVVFTRAFVYATLDACLHSVFVFVCVCVCVGSCVCACTSACARAFLWVCACAHFRIMPIMSGSITFSFSRLRR